MAEPLARLISDRVLDDAKASESFRLRNRIYNSSQILVMNGIVDQIQLAKPLRDHPGQGKSKGSEVAFVDLVVDQR